MTSRSRVIPMKQRRICTLLASLFFALFSTGQLAAQSSAVVTLVKAGRLLDPRTGNVLSPAAVLIEDGKIKEVGSACASASGMRRPVSEPLIWAAQPCCPG